LRTASHHRCFLSSRGAPSPEAPKAPMFDGKRTHGGHDESAHRRSSSSPRVLSEKESPSLRPQSDGAEGGTRTPTVLLPPAPQAGASANSATSAWLPRRCDGEAKDIADREDPRRRRKIYATASPRYGAGAGAAGAGAGVAGVAGAGAAGFGAGAAGVVAAAGGAPGCARPPTTDPGPR
jgi:hypothetical protein